MNSLEKTPSGTVGGGWNKINDKYKKSCNTESKEIVETHSTLEVIKFTWFENYKENEIFLDISLHAWKHTHFTKILAMLYNKM